MHTFSVDDNLIKFLEKLMLKYNYVDLQGAIEKCFIVMHIVDMVDEEKWEILIKNNDGAIVKFSLYQEKKEIQENTNPVEKI